MTTPVPPQVPRDCRAADKFERTAGPSVKWFDLFKSFSDAFSNLGPMNKKSSMRIRYQRLETIGKYIVAVLFNTSAKPTIKLLARKNSLSSIRRGSNKSLPFFFG